MKHKKRIFQAWAKSLLQIQEAQAVWVLLDRGPSVRAI